MLDIGDGNRIYWGGHGYPQAVATVAMRSLSWWVRRAWSAGKNVLLVGPLPVSALAR